MIVHFSALCSHRRPAVRPGARFVAGTPLGARYRIVTLLGRGGMGEVYPADDLTLDQPVALKFLPDALAAQGPALARFQAARIARQVSHRNVCRVYDIGEADGLPFLTMEFIDGEDRVAQLDEVRVRVAAAPEGSEGGPSPQSRSRHS